jgi:hypothetical protein
MFEGYGKVFVVNEENLKVADFINVKIATADVGSHPPDKGNVLTGGSSGAKMVVDYITALSSACTIYGRRTTTATFSTEAVTGTDDDGNSISFTTSGNEDTGGGSDPHWYTWTVYGGSTDYGALPDQATLGCLYLGRCVLAGDEDYPHQWYMSRQADPWDWKYIANDAQTPIAGNDADAGEMGDIIRALIPYRDEYLLFGCASSIWVLRGDPAFGGTMSEVDLTVGMWGSQSFTFDGDGNLYFVSHAGDIRILPAGFGPIKPISKDILPNLAIDEQLDPSLHRITMAYDRDRHGVLVSMTLLSDGTNSCYWYDLTTGGLYPESYPTTCGAYSMFYYTANDDAYRTLLIGGKDGYIRRFNDTTKNDVTTSSVSTITSYMLLSILRSEDDDREIMLQSLTVTTAGGASGGSFSDTDSVDVEIYRANADETLLENVEDGDTPLHDKSLSGTGRKYRIRDRTRGHSIGIRLHNDTAGETWAIERISGEVEEKGKVR